MEWAQVKAMAADGLSQSEISRRLELNRRTVKRLIEAAEPPSYSREPAGSMLDPVGPVLERLLADWPEIKAPRVTEILRDDYGYVGSVDLVRKRLAQLRPRSERPARRGRAIGRGRVYALMCSVLRGGDGAFLVRHDDRVVLGGARPGV